jgi:spore coat protein CotF
MNLILYKITWSNRGQLDEFRGDHTLQMNNNQQQMPKQPSPTGQPQANHGGHEVFDAHENLSGLIDVLDQFMMFDQYIQDPELKSILTHQRSFIEQTYNCAVESFTTGRDPSQPTQSYQMNQNNTVTYGLTPSQPRKPAQNLSELNDQKISGQMLGLLKSTASLLTMTSLEVTNPVLRRVYADSVPNFIEMSYELFLYQNKHQYYQVPRLQQQDMQQMLQGFAPSNGMSLGNQQPGKLQ